MQYGAFFYQSKIASNAGGISVTFSALMQLHTDLVLVYTQSHTPHTTPHFTTDMVLDYASFTTSHHIILKYTLINSCQNAATTEKTGTRSRVE